jgi:hypothetical protein
MKVTGMHSAHTSGTSPATLQRKKQATCRAKLTFASPGGQVLILVASVLAGMATWQASSGLTGDELPYLPDTFPIVRRKDETRYGEYRTKRLVFGGV